MKMSSGICHLTVIPLRAEPSHRSEMVSQLLFGETFRVLETSGDWVRVMCHSDNYEGWIQEKQCFSVPDDLFDRYLRAEKMRLSVPFVASGIEVPNVLVMGSLTVKKIQDSPFQERLPVPDAEIWMPADGAPDMSRAERMALLRQRAFLLLGTSYLWGGRTPFGIDCSGFTQLLYSMVGVQLPRDASQQVSFGEPLDFLSEARLGDLAFFQDEDGHIIHVGMMLNDNKIIHASGRVRIDTVDECGIFNEELHRYTHSLRVTMRL